MTNSECRMRFAGERTLRREAVGLLRPVWGSRRLGFGENQAEERFSPLAHDHDRIARVKVLLVPCISAVTDRRYNCSSRVGVRRVQPLRRERFSGETLRWEIATAGFRSREIGDSPWEGVCELCESV